jgi:hypothetical protein
MRQKTPPSLPRDSVVASIAVDNDSPKSLPTATSPREESNLTKSKLTRSMSQAERERDAEREKMSMWETSRIGSHDNKSKNHVLSPTMEIDIPPSAFTDMRTSSAVDLVAATSNLFQTENETARRLSQPKPHRLSKTNPTNSPVISSSRRPSLQHVQSPTLTKEEQEWENGIATTPGKPIHRVG